jgi:hypothetical protein
MCSDTSPCTQENPRKDDTELPLINSVCPYGKYDMFGYDKSFWIKSIYTEKSV